MLFSLNGKQLIKKYIFLEKHPGSLFEKIAKKNALHNKIDKNEMSECAKIKTETKEAKKIRTDENLNPRKRNSFSKVLRGVIFFAISQDPLKTYVDKSFHRT